jgi:hypothetical protein
MKINVPDELAQKMGLFREVDFQKIALNAIENYVNENEPRLTFEEKEARRILMSWRGRQEPFKKGHPQIL